MCAGQQELDGKEFRGYASQQKEMGALSRRSTLLRATLLDGQERQAVILNVARAEWREVLELVIMPFFLRSTQLLCPHWPGLAMVMDWHRAGGAPPETDRPSSSNTPQTWLERPGLVKLDKRWGKKRKEIVTACVAPAASSKITHLALVGEEWVNQRDVKWKLGGGGYYQLTFNVRAAVIAKGCRGSQWEEMDGEAEGVMRVQLYLHQLMFYFRKGFTDWRDLPLTKQVVGSKSRGIVHVGECRKGCCCPWHLEMRSQQENVLRSYRYRKQKGSNHHYTYTEQPEGVSHESNDSD